MGNEPVPRPAPPRFRLAAGMTWRRWLIDIVLIAGGVISVIFEPFSIALHSIVGLAFAGTVGPHLWCRRAPTRINVHGIASLILIGVVARHAWTRRG